MTTTELKLKFIKDMLNNPEITSLVDVYDEYAEYPEDMIDERVFTWWQFKSEVLQKAKVIMGFKIDYPSVANNVVFKNFRMSVLILCHKDLMKVKNRSGSRLDLLGDTVMEQWTWNREGLPCRVELVSNNEDTFNDDYYARTIVFKSKIDNNIEDGVKRNG